MKKITTLVALTALALGAIAVAVPTANAQGSTQSSPRTQGTIVETAVAAGQFKTLAKLLKRAGLVSTLEKPGPYTVFAPTDAAFAKLPKATVAALLANKAKLRAVLLYHVVAGKLTASRITKLSSVKTSNGEALRIRVRGGTVLVNSARVTKANVPASNGVIHVINRVLVPSM